MCEDIKSYNFIFPSKFRNILCSKSWRTRFWFLSRLQQRLNSVKMTKFADFLHLAQNIKKQNFSRFKHGRVIWCLKLIKFFTKWGKMIFWQLSRAFKGRTTPNVGKWRKRVFRSENGSKIVTSFFRGSYLKNEVEGPPYMKHMLKFHRFAINWYIPYI